MGRAPSPRCVQCGNATDTAEHTLLDCPYWEHLRVELSGHVGHRLTVSTLSNIVCGPKEVDLPPDPDLQSSLIDATTESLRLFYKMVEGLLSLKKDEERARQAAEAVGQN